MKTAFSLLILLISHIGHAQIFYSSKIPNEYIKALKKLEMTLKKEPFLLPETISDTFHLTVKDSLSYSKIFSQFIDTAGIKNLKGRQTYYMEQAKEENWLKAMTVNFIIGIHHLIQCVPDSLFFVMPASEYSKIDTTDDRVKYSSADLLVAGYYRGDYYYPVISMLFSKKNFKIIYINLLINFDGYRKEKQKYFDENLSPLIMPCERTFTDNSNDQNSYPLPLNKKDTIRVIEPMIKTYIVTDTSTFVNPIN